MKVSYIVFICLCLSGSSCAGRKSADDLRTKVAGQWEVSIAGLPFANSFILDIREKDKAIVFDIIQDQSFAELDIKEMRFTEKDGKLSANLYIGEFIKLIIWTEEDIVKGELRASMIGDLPLILKKL